MVLRVQLHPAARGGLPQDCVCLIAGNRLQPIEKPPSRWIERLDRFHAADEGEMDNFFGEFLGVPEPPASEVLPQEVNVRACAGRLLELARPRLTFLALQTEPWWLARVSFFDVERERIWIFWRRVLHTAHHRAQLTGYLRMLNKPVPPVYGPTADATWIGADPTNTEDAARRA